MLRLIVDFGCVTFQSTIICCWGSYPGQGKRFSFLQKLCKLTLGPTQPPLQWVPEFLPEGKAAGE